MGHSVAIVGTRGYPSYYGGFETAVRKLAPYLANKGWDVEVFGRDGATKDDDADRDPRVKTTVTRGIESKSASTLTYGFTSSYKAARNRPDAALIMNVANGFWLPFFKAHKVPTLLNVDGIEWDRAKWGRAAKTMFKAGARASAWWADELVCDSHEIARRWREGFGVDGTFIPYGGDVPAALPVEPGLTPGSYVLMVARFVPENTVDEFLAAVDLLPRDVDVVIVGSSGYGGTYDDHAKALSDARSNVRWLGHLHDDRRLFSLWQHAGVYFHGHSVGGTNPALVQAMACRAPVVARDTVYNREVLGEYGVFVAPEAGAIRDSILKVLGDRALQEELASGAFQRSREIYSWEGVCGQYEQSLLSLIEGEGR